MKKLTILSLALVLLAITGGGSQAGLFDDLFGSKTKKNPHGYGRIVWRQDGRQDTRLELASRQPPAGLELAPGEFLVPSPEEDFPAPPPGAQPVGLFPRVKYKDRDKIHPFSVKMIVQVKDPIRVPRDPCNCRRPAPRFVFVEICVPPCGCRKIDVSDDGDEVEYDFGDYEVEIKSEKGMVVVEYDD